MDTMTHRERLRATVRGEAVDRPAVALWRHFPDVDQDAATLAQATLEFQREWDFDFVKVTPSSGYCLYDWGARDEWRGDPEGTREYTHRPVKQPDDWRRLAVLDPKSGALGRQLECLQRVRAGLEPATPVIQTIFSPLAQAKNLAGTELLDAHFLDFPQHVTEGLATIAETTRRFIEAAIETGIDGVFYAIQHASRRVFSVEQYRRFGRETDMMLLDAARSLWLNVLHLHGDDVMAEEAVGFSAQVVNWHDRETAPSLREGRRLFGTAVCGGLGRWETMVQGAPDRVAAEARGAIGETGGRGFILGTGCVTPIVAPRVNIEAARQSVGPFEAGNARRH